MKHLTILRHAKADRPEDYSRDFDRPLTKRGIKDAALVAAHFAKLEPAIDWVISSPAARTRQTTEQILPRLQMGQQVHWEDAVYAATADVLLGVLQSAPPEVSHILLVGHNPGMEELVSGLAAGSPTRLSCTLATAAFAHLEIEIVYWNQVRWGSGRLLMLVPPKLLRA